MWASLNPSVRLLLHYGADVNLNNKTALMYASKNNLPRCSLRRARMST